MLGLPSLTSDQVRVELQFQETVRMEVKLSMVNRLNWAIQDRYQLYAEGAASNTSSVT